jgi:tetratricopeptide (TPR) repeat protein
MNGKLQEAEKKYNEAITIHRQLGNNRSLGIMLGNMGDLLILRKKWTKAEDSLQQSIEICDAVFPIAGAVFRGSMGLVMAQKGHINEARRLLKEGEKVLRDKNTIELGKLLCKSALIEHQVNNRETAESFFREAQEVAKRMKVNEKSELGQRLTELKRLF